MPERPTHNNDARTASSANAAVPRRIRTGPDLVSAERRIRQVLRSKGRTALGYWSSKGCARFARELAADGLRAEDAAALLKQIEDELVSAAMDGMLEQLKAREFRDVPPTG